MSEVRVHGVRPDEWGDDLVHLAETAAVELPWGDNRAIVFVAERVKTENDRHPAGPIGIAVCRWSGLSGTVEGKVVAGANSSAPIAHDGLMQHVQQLGQVMSMPFHRLDGRALPTTHELQ